jgi:hypothetical protein
MQQVLHHPFARSRESLVTTEVLVPRVSMLYQTKQKVDLFNSLFNPDEGRSSVLTGQHHHDPFWLHTAGEISVAVQLLIEMLYKLGFWQTCARQSVGLHDGPHIGLKHKPRTGLDRRAP